MSDEAALELSTLKELTWRYVIDQPALGSQQPGQQRIVQRLYTDFRDAAGDRKRRPLLPIGAREDADEAEADGTLDTATLARPHRLRCRVPTDREGGARPLPAPDGPSAGLGT